MCREAGRGGTVRVSKRRSGAWSGSGGSASPGGMSRQGEKNPARRVADRNSCREGVATSPAAGRVRSPGNRFRRFRYAGRRLSCLRATRRAA